MTSVEITMFAIMCSYVQINMYGLKSWQNYLWYVEIASSLHFVLQKHTQTHFGHGITARMLEKQCWQFVPYFSGCRAYVIGDSLRMVVPT